MAAKELKQIIKDYLKGTDFKEIDDTISIERVWKKIVGKPISNNTTIEMFNKGTIKIKASNPVWRNELSLQKKDILNKLRKKEPGLNIKEIILI